MPIRSAPVDLVAESIYCIGSQLEFCYFIGSRTEEVEAASVITECTSLYYIPDEDSYFVVKSRDKCVVAMGYIVSYNNCWISIILPTELGKCNADGYPDRMFDDLADEYAELYADIAGRVTSAAIKSLKKEPLYEYKRASRECYCCEIMDTKPHFHRGRGQFNTCYEYVVEYDFWTY